MWSFIAVDHFNSECVGCPIFKEGTRFNPLEPIRIGLDAVSGAVGRDAAPGLALRMDHGCQYTSGHFLNQIASPPAPESSPSRPSTEPPNVLPSLKMK